MNQLSRVVDLVSDERESGNAYYLSARHFDKAGVCEVSAIKLTADDSLKQGGGGRRKNTDKESMDDRTYYESLRRSKSAIRRLVLAMCADRLLSLTFRENVTDLDVAWPVFKYFVRLMRKRYKNFQYVAVPEFQLRGAVHFHLAISGFYHVQTVRRFWLQAAGKFKGNIDITSPKKANKKSWNPKRIAAYISKYVSKSDVVNFNKKRYSHGGDIEVPKPMKGWLAVGGYTVGVMRDICESLTGNRVAVVKESKVYFDIIYVST